MQTPSFISKLKPNDRRLGSVLACDVGGTRIKCGIVCHGRLLARSEIQAEATQGFSAALIRIAGELPSLCRNSRVPPHSLIGFGLSFPGIIHPQTGKILSTPSGKFDDAKELAVPKLVEARLGLPTRICNDANAALLGESRYGAARGCRDVVMMTLGTGIGTAAILDGVLLRGRHGQAGCLGGHWTTNVAGSVCPCGNLGCAESEASTWALPERARRHPMFAQSSLARVQNLDYAALFRAAGQRDSLVMELRGHSLRVWSAALVNLIHAYDPALAVIGGGVMQSGGVILPRLRQYVARHAWTPWGRVRIKSAALGNDAGMLGVASLFLESPGAGLSVPRPTPVKRAPRSAARDS